MECITRMVEDEDEQTLIDVQIDDFQKRAKNFGCPMATRSINLNTPADCGSLMVMSKVVELASPHRLVGAP